MSKNEKNKKEYFGRFYGMRIENYKDKNIKTTLMKLSKKRNIPINRLIFDYLEKALGSSEERELNIDKEELIENFDIFLDKVKKKLIYDENILKMSNFEKKESLKIYIYDKYPGEIQKKKFFLELLKTQIQCEIELLFDFLFLYNYRINEYVGYYRYICESRHISFTDSNYNKIINEHLTNLYLQWYYELKTTGIIRDLNDFKKLDKIKDFEDIINYEALEVFVFDLYEGKKLLYSSKEEYIRLIDNLEKDPIKKTKTKPFTSHFKEIFRELVKYFKGLSNEVLHLEESEYQLFHKIGYKPHIFYKILDLDGYINFIEKNKLRKALTESFYDKLLLYKQFNDFYSFPPISLLTNIAMFSNYLNGINKFIERLPELIEQKAYSLDDIRQIGIYLTRLTSNFPGHQSWSQILLKQISIKNIDELGKIIPKNYDNTLKFIKDYLLNRGIDLDLFMERITQMTEKTLLQERTMIFDSYPERIKTKIDKSLKEFENELKNN